METWLLLEYGWARDIAAEVIGGDDVTVIRIESIPPSPERDVSLWAFDKATGHSVELTLRTVDYDINGEEEREEKVRSWAGMVKDEFERRRHRNYPST